MWYIDIESKIVEHGRRKETNELNKIRETLMREHNEANYFLSRFLDEYGDQIEENQNAANLYRTFYEKYTRVERLLTILNAYDKK